MNNGNRVELKGILRNVQPSHKIKGINFDKAELVVNSNNSEDVINLKFKKFSNPYKEGQEISLVGNVRSFSSKNEDNSNNVEVYVFTYFDIPEDDLSNHFSIEGRICKKTELRQTKYGKEFCRIILANNIFGEGIKINSYLPCIAWGKNAKDLNTLDVSDKIRITGKLKSREYKKDLPDGQFEIRVCHELIIEDFALIWTLNTVI